MMCFIFIHMKRVWCNVVTGGGGKKTGDCFCVVYKFLKQGSNDEHLKLVQYFHQNSKMFLTDTLANDGTNHITVLNSERLNSGTGPIKVIHGYATPSDTPGKLTVHLESVIFDAPCMYFV